MMSKRTILSLTLFMVLFAASVADINITPTTAVTLHQFGESDTVLTVIASGTESEVSVSSSSIYNVGTITSVPGEEGFTNYTIPLSMDAEVGMETLSVTINGETTTATIIVAGIVIKEGDKIVSGDNAEGVTVGIEGTTTYDVIAVGTDGNSVDVSGASITGEAISGTYMKNLDADSTVLTSTSFALGIAKYRTSPDPWKVSFDIAAIQLNGESFETSLTVAHSPTTAPCVAIGGTYTANDGVVMVDMYNVVSGADDVTISVDGSEGKINTGASSYTMPDQKIAFDFATAGTAKIMCGSVEAEVVGSGMITIEVATSTEELAKDFVFDVPEVDGLDQLTVRLSITASDPDVLTRVEAGLVIDEFCKTCGVERGPDSCEVRSVTKGSAVLELVGNVENGVEKEGLAKSSVEDCTFTDNIDKPCDYLTFVLSTVNAVGGATTPAAVGLATWTIVLIAGLGAFALIVLIMLGLLAVYRRSAEQSESDYSSSGPLGVPDPSDLLYEQSIVRDIYGRGDFPDGGPSAAVAEQREREAALREEFPRPPSSSGLSRGSATDDASSTYSV